MNYTACRHNARMKLMLSTDEILKLKHFTVSLPAFRVVISRTVLGALEFELAVF